MTRISGSSRIGTAAGCLDPHSRGGPNETALHRQIAVEGERGLTAAHRRFEPARHGRTRATPDGRTGPHAHAEPRAAVKELGVGESDYTGPNLVHWHGGGPPGARQIEGGSGGERSAGRRYTDAEYKKQEKKKKKKKGGGMRNANPRRSTGHNLASRAKASGSAACGARRAASGKKTSRQPHVFRRLGARTRAEGTARRVGARRRGGPASGGRSFAKKRVAQR